MSEKHQRYTVKKQEIQNQSVLERVREGQV